VRVYTNTHLCRSRVSVAITETSDQTTPAPGHTATPKATPSNVTNRLNTTPSNVTNRLNATPSNLTNRLNATPSNVTNQDQLLRGDDLVAVAKTIVDRSVIKLSALKQSLHLQRHKVNDTDLVEALQVADIIEIDCKVHYDSNNYNCSNRH